MAFLKQFLISIVDELVYLLIFNFLAKAREIERGYHVSPVLLDQVRDEEFLLKTAMVILINLYLFTSLATANFVP